MKFELELSQQDVDIILAAMWHYATAQHGYAAEIARKGYKNRRGESPPKHVVDEAFDGAKQTDELGKRIGEALSVRPSPPIAASDIRLEPLSSGSAPGAMSVGKIPAGVRVVHIPTGNAAESRNLRTSMANRAAALSALERLTHNPEGTSNE